MNIWLAVLPMMLYEISLAQSIIQCICINAAAFYWMKNVQLCAIEIIQQDFRKTMYQLFWPPFWKNSETNDASLESPNVELLESGKILNVASIWGLPLNPNQTGLFVQVCWGSTATIFIQIHQQWSQMTFGILNLL